MFKRAFLISFVILLPAIAQAALTVQLSISPTHTLPALPVSFHITIDNPDAIPKTLPVGGILIVTSAGEEPWFAVSYGSHVVEDLTLWMMGVTTIAPHGHYTFDIPLEGTLENPAWFTDPRLNLPGTYRLRFVLSDIDSEKLRTMKPMTLSAASSNSAFSNEVVLTVDTPTGDDAAVWRLVAARSKNQRVHSGDWGVELVREVLREHRNSTYSRYVVVRYPLDSIENWIKAIEEALAAAPNDPFADWQQFKIADLEQHLYGTAWGRGRDASILRLHGERAVTMYRAVIRTAHSTFARWLAQKKLDDFRSDLEDDGIDVN